jgi:hypothetical protein
MSMATTILNVAISHGAVKYQITYLSLWADNFFNDEAKDRVIFQFDGDNSAIIVCTKTWTLDVVKQFNAQQEAPKARQIIQG